MSRNSKKTKVLVCLSGGVDSSVAAALLIQAGYTVTGAFMINYDNSGGPNCWLHEYRDAVRVAAHLGIPLVRWDFTAEYKKDVLGYMYREYRAGRTPNPDVLCNTYIKFDAWLQKARAAGFDYIATGHYANILNNTLLKSKDAKKDQTYFLHQLSQEQLSSVIFPVGKYTKIQVRGLAKKFGLPTAQKVESMGICFVGEVPMKEFLEKKIKRTPGDIVLSLTGEVIGQHDGLAFYTIGQRHNLMSREAPGTSQGNALYVVDKNTKKNILTVGPKNDPGLLKKEIKITNIHWISGQTPHFPVQCEVRLRHQQPLRKVVISEKRASGNSRDRTYFLTLNFTQPQWGATPGQFAVLYSGDECLGGGVVI